MTEVSKRITLVYTTSVYVEVDIEDSEVWKVVVADEGVEYDHAQTLAYNLDGSSEASEEEITTQIDVARAFADEADWPAWSFG